MSTSILLTYTTTPLSLTDGLEQLLSPLAKIRVPVHDFSMMMTIALRFIPTLIEETNKIMNAQTARGASFSEGNILKRAKSAYSRSDSASRFFIPPRGGSLQTQWNAGVIPEARAGPE